MIVSVALPAYSQDNPLIGGWLGILLVGLGLAAVCYVEFAPPPEGNFGEIVYSSCCGIVDFGHLCFDG